MCDKLCVPNTVHILYGSTDVANDELILNEVAIKSFKIVQTDMKI